MDFSGTRRGDHSDDSQRRTKNKITEERIAEYLAKKAHKKAMKVAKKLKPQKDVSNDSNPFGDSNLDETFVWRKKIERDVLSHGVPLDFFSVKAEKKRRRERMAEIEKVKKRRAERAIKKAQHEEEMAFLARKRYQAEFRDWERKEEEFLFNQSKIRLEIRLREGRVKPIDILTKKLNPSDTVFKGLTVEELEDLCEDIKMHLDLDRANPTHIRYWEALLVVCEWELDEANKRDALERARIRGEQLPGEMIVEEEVKDFLQGKTYGELEVLQSQIQSMMESGAAKVVEYWEAVLKRIPILKAKACLKEIHENNKIENSTRPDQEADDSEILSPRSAIHVQAKDEEEQVVSYAVDPDSFEKNALKAMGAMEEGDAEFGKSDETNLDLQVYWWHDKYRPRKPEYYNRVHTGYEWNKYNRTHYDHDSPPPKTVQGYKFNIYYPDLIDKSKAPTYTIEKDGDSTETCIIRFHAGPLYEDIAFRIVNKEWEYSRKKGFKCTFERGILQVYFNVKRYRYRR